MKKLFIRQKKCRTAKQLLLAMMLCLANIPAMGDVGKKFTSEKTDFTFTILTEEEGNNTVSVETTRTGLNIGPDVVIPATATDPYSKIEYKVTKVAYCGFYRKENIKSVTMGENIQEIDNSAFSGCENLQTVIFNKGLKRIGFYAFYETAVENIVLPEGLERLEYECFYNCKKLKSVSLPTTFTYSHEDHDCKEQFYGCEMFEEIRVPDNHPTMKVKNGILYTSNLKKVLLCPPAMTNVKIEPTVTTLDEDCFYGNGMTAVTLPQGLRTIKDRAFGDCRNLAKIIIPKSVSKVGQRPFYGCGNLTELKVEEGTAFQIFPTQLYDGTAVKDVAVPEGIIRISCFTSPVENVTIPSTVVSLGLGSYTGFAWETCKNVTVAEGNATYASIDGVLYNKAKTEMITYPAGREDKTYTIPANAKAIGDLAFHGAKNLQEVIFHNGVESIGNSAFTDTGLKAVTVPGTIKTLGYAAFGYCRSLESVTFEEGITEIPGSGFQGCWELTNIIMPSTLKRIDGNAFWACSKLTEINFPEGLEEIGSHAFYNCVQLEKVEFPATLKLLEESAFASCDSLAEVTFNSNPEIGEFVFDKTKWLDSQEEGIVYIGTVLYAYKGAMPEDFKIAAEDIREGTTMIANRALDRRQLTEITLPESITHIGTRAFKNASFTSIKIPASVTSIGSNAFPDIPLDSIVVDEGNSCYGKTGCFLYNKPTGEAVFCDRNMVNDELVIPDEIVTFHEDIIESRNWPTISIGKNFSHFNTYKGKNKEIGIINGMSFALTTINLSEENPYFTMVDGIMYDAKQETVICCPRKKAITKLTMPKTVTRIGREAFSQNETLEEAILSPNTIVVGESGFFGCRMLKKVDLGQKLTTLEEYAFYGCDELTTLCVPATFTAFGEMGGKSFMGNINYIMFTTIGDIEIDVSEVDSEITISYPCVNNITIEANPYVTLEPYSGIYQDGQITKQDEYQEETMTDNTLYFTTNYNYAALSNVVTVKNVPNDPSGGSDEDDEDDSESGNEPGSGKDDGKGTGIDGKKAKRLLTMKITPIAKAKERSGVTAHCTNLRIKDGIEFTTPIPFTVDNATVERSVSNSWSAIALPFSAEVPANCQAAELAADNELTATSGKINFTTVTGKMQAGKGYLIKTTEGTTAELTAENITVDAVVEPQAGSQFIGNIDGTITFNEEFRSLPENTGYEFFRFSSDENKFVKLGLTDTCLPYSAYLKLATGIDASALPFIVGQEDTNGIESVNLRMKPAGGIFNLNGMKQNTTHRGINIINGKKMIIIK